MSLRPTKTELVYTRLRADVLAGRLLPGQRLRYAELCERYETSMGVLREALLRLAEQALVRGEPQQGFQVVSLSREDLLELTEVRREFETFTLARAVRDGDLDWESRLIAAHHRLSRTPQLDPDDNARLGDRWVSAHAEFHNTLLDGCANTRLKAVTASLRDSAELYRRWSVPLGHAGERDVAAEHVAIVEAAVARDADAAVVLLAAHIEATSTSLLTWTGEGPAATDAGERAAVRSAT